MNIIEKTNDPGNRIACFIKTDTKNNLVENILEANKFINNKKKMYKEPLSFKNFKKVKIFN